MLHMANSCFYSPGRVLHFKMKQMAPIAVKQAQGRREGAFLHDVEAKCATAGTGGVTLARRATVK